MIQVDRVVPEVPQAGQKLRVVIDTDFGNEIDDMYALALACVYPERFQIEGIIGANYNNISPGSGPQSPEYSCKLIHSFLSACVLEGRYTVKQGAHPIQYYGHPSHAEGVDWIIERALAGTPEDPLWVVGLGAATDLASAVLLCPDIQPLVRYVFHARWNREWPHRTRQFNVQGDVHAARTLLRQWVPLVWFDTGTQLMLPMAVSEKYLAPLGKMGRYMHDYRLTQDWFQNQDKGFFDLGDMVYLLKPDLCKQEIVKAPNLDMSLNFSHDETNGNMMRVYDIDSNASWNLLFDGMARYQHMHP